MPRHPREIAKEIRETATREEIEARLAEAETTIGALKHLIGEQADEISELKAAIDSCSLVMKEMNDANIEVNAEIAELRADLEWAAKFCRASRRYDDETGFPRSHFIEFWDGSPDFLDGRDYDGTPSDLRRVIRAGRKGE
jgi:uncharacterized coiled-coil protein SlyX